MKNQNDIIVSVVALVVALIVVAVCFFTKRDPVTPPAPEVIDIKMPALPASDVVLADQLPGGQTGGGSGAGPGGPGMARGGPMASGLSGTSGPGRPSGNAPSKPRPTPG